MISYTITIAERLEDGERGMSEHSCGLCGVDYKIERGEWTNVVIEPGYEVAKMTNYRVTDDCTCHTDYMEAISSGQALGARHG